jgi:glutamate--cysteine ligase
MITDPLHDLEKEILAKHAGIEAWLRKQWLITPAPFYSSVDLRNANFKLAPVDTNLFPAGFNNISPKNLPLSFAAVQMQMAQRFPGAKKILIIPEAHTRNQYYIENLATLYEIFQKAGFEVRLGSLVLDQQMPLEVTTLSGKVLDFYSIYREENTLLTHHFTPDLILLNNDLSEGTPEILVGLQQPIMPTLNLGWDNRLKSDHFTHYNEVANDFADLVGFDPWLINPLFRNCDNLDFMDGDGIEVLMENASELFSSIQKKYAQYNLKQEPFVIIKADAGSYGMGIMSIKSPEELATLNRKQRTRMATTKGKQNVSKVILQEGVYTEEKSNGGIAEPVIYMIGEYVVGGFYRVHNERSNTENLNAPGMHFATLDFPEQSQSGIDLATSQLNTDELGRLYVYGVIARLAALAAAREIYIVEGIISGKSI